MGFFYSLTDTEWTRRKAWAVVVALQWTYAAERLSTQEYYEALGYFDDQTSLIKQLRAVWTQLVLIKLCNPVKIFEFLFCFAYVIIDHLSLWFISAETGNRGYLNLISVEMLILSPFRLIAVTFKLGYGLLQCITAPINKILWPFVQYLQIIWGYSGSSFIRIPPELTPSFDAFGIGSLIVTVIFILILLSVGGALPGVPLLLGILSAYLAPITGGIGGMILASAALIVASAFIPIMVHRLCKEFVHFFKDLFNMFGDSNYNEGHPGYNPEMEIIAYMDCKNTRLWTVEKECIDHQFYGYLLSEYNRVRYENADETSKIECLSHYSAQTYSWKHAPPESNAENEDKEGDANHLLYQHKTNLHSIRYTEAFRLFTANPFDPHPEELCQFDLKASQERKALEAKKKEHEASAREEIYTRHQKNAAHVNFRPRSSSGGSGGNSSGGDS